MNDDPSRVPLVTDLHSTKGEPEPEQVWQEPADRLLIHLKTKATRTGNRRGTVAAGDLRAQRRCNRQAFTALAPVPRPLRQPADHHPADRQRGVRGDR